MGAFRKFDPRTFRETHAPLPGPAKPAEAAKPSWPPQRRFSSFSRFSSGTAPTRDSWQGADWLAYFDERAAIREYDGGASRVDAERLAFGDAVAHWMSLHPPSPTPPDSCVHCSEPERRNDVLMPMLADGGHTWIHDSCWTAWDRAQRETAIGCLGSMGLSRPPAANAGEPS